MSDLTALFDTSDLDLAEEIDSSDLVEICESVVLLIEAVQS